ncbi:MAG: hypothetical protein ACI4XE_09955 [Acutalibacteraceae bacterium]
MKKAVTLLLSVLLLFCFSACNSDGNKPTGTADNIIQTTNENYQKLLTEAQECDRALESLYSDNKADFEAAAKAVLSLPDTDKLTIKASEGGKSVETVYQNRSSVLFPDLFPEKEQAVILRCLEKMKSVSPQNTDIIIEKTTEIFSSNSEIIRFTFRVQDVWVDLGLAYCEKNDTGYTHINGNFYKFYEGLV